MSNLGWYQGMTTAAKRVGGPKNLLILTLVTGGVLYKCGETISKKIYNSVKGVSEKNESPQIYKVTAEGKDGKHLLLNVGDTFRILESDGDSVLIEKIGDPQNPYFTSADFLRSVSDFCYDC